MPRYARHTKPALRQETREKIVYAGDMFDIDQTGAVFTDIGYSPVWQFPDGQDSYVHADLKVPNDRVPGTPITVKLVFGMTVEGGIGQVALYVGYYVVGYGESIQAGVFAPAWLLTPAPALNNSYTTPGFLIPASEMAGHRQSIDIQMRIGRDGIHVADTSVGTVNLLKAIFEYTAYV